MENVGFMALRRNAFKVQTCEMPGDAVVVDPVHPEPV
jgi:hypothetical protein